MKETGVGLGRLSGLPSCLGPLRMEGLILYCRGATGAAPCWTPSESVFGVFLGVVFGHLQAFAGICRHLQAFAGATGSPRASLIPCVSGVVRLLVGGALT